MLCTAAALTSCSKPVGQGAACLPEAARPYLAGAAGLAASAPPAPSGPVNVYVDGSGSMVGFLRASASGELRPFQDFLAKLPSAAAGGRPEQAQLRYHLFGSKVRPLDAAGSVQLVQEAAYQCPPGQVCDNQESRLDAALAEVRKAPADSLSIIVSDLWLSSSTLATTGAVAVGAPLVAMLGEGRAVGVLGLRAPYQGGVYDLPSGADYTMSGRRPLYVLLIGPTERVEALRRWYAQDGTAGFAEGDARFSLFTLDPVEAGSAEQPAVQLTGGAVAQKPFLPPSAGIALSQVVLNAEAAVRERVRPGPAGPSSLSVAVDPEDRVRAGAVWRGPTAGRTQVWRLRGQPCAAGAWTPMGDLQGGWSGPGGRSFSLPAAEAAARLPKGGDYLLVGALQRTALNTPNSANGWMRDWSFNSSTEAAVLRGRPEFFPTLNLAETARQLETALGEAATRRPVALGGFAVAVRVQD